MRTSVLCNLAAAVLAALANARCTTSLPDPSSEPETSPQLEAPVRRPRGAEGADALQGPWCSPCVRALRQLQEQLQLHDAATRALLEQMKQENDASRALLEKIQQENDASRALLDKRLQQIEQMNLTAKKDGEASSEMKLLMNQLDKRLMNLEANVQRVLQQLPSSEPKASIATSPPTCSPASVSSSTLTFLPSSVPTCLPSSTFSSLPSAVPTSLPSTAPTSLSSPTAKSTPSPSRLGEELWRAAGERSVERVRSLLDAGADVNFRGTEGRSPLMEALYNNGYEAPCSEAVESLLLQRGALAGAVDDNKWTPLHFAASHDSSARCVALLVGAGADVEARDEWRGTPLHTAAANNNAAAVRALLGAGADANARDMDGTTPLHWAAYNSNEGMTRALLAAGARKDLRPWEGGWKDKTPFDVAGSDALRSLLRP